jgi:hypothetical protein
VAAILAASSMCSFERVPGGSKNVDLQHVGNIFFNAQGVEDRSPAYKVFVSNSMFRDGVDNVTVLYKGKGEVDTGVVYSPYVLLGSFGMAVDAATFQPVERFFHRSNITVQAIDGNNPVSNYIDNIGVTITTA